MNKPAELIGVTKRFASATALDDLSMSIQPGELLALLGPNGAGKTTAARLLLGLTRLDKGQVTVFGLDPRKSRNRVRIGAMLQVARVPETLRVAEHVELFSSYYPKPLPQAQVMETAGLRGLENRPFGELSGGQKQRVLFALAICGSPDLLILDEPTVGLDVDARRTMWEAIRKMVQRGVAVLLTTHYLQEADSLADRVVVIDRGRIIAEGAPADIKQRVAGKRIRCSTSLAPQELTTLPFVTKVTRDGAVTEVLTSNSEAVVRELLARDRSLSNLEISGAGLEDAFLSLTKEVA